MLSKLKENKKVTLLATVAVVALLGGGLYAWYVLPPAMPTTVEEATALLKSDRFQRLSAHEKRDYHDRIAELFGPLDRDHRRQLMRDRELRDAGRDMFRQMMLQRARAFALADEAGREAMIAEDLARMEAMRGQRPRPEQGERPPRPERSEEERAERRRDRQDQIEDWVNNGNGQDWALIREYWQNIRQRRPRQTPRLQNS
jgi:hypothetical protein